MRHYVILPRIKWLLAIAVVAVASASCDGNRGEQGPAGLAGPPGPGINPTFSATALEITIDGVTVNSAPVVDFSVEDENNLPFVGLTTSDLRFSIAKLTPGANLDPSVWQSYINRSSNGAMQASQERDRPGYPLGALVDHGDGSYTYTFATDLTAASCPAPCTDADGNPLDVSYNPNLSHRVVIQLGHSIIDGLPPENAVYTFRPADGATSSIFSREIVKTGNCNECHNQLRIHGSRVETQFCVTCHNPGTWDPNGNTADFKVMIHKIHRGEDLPSGNPYQIGGHDYSTVAYPQDIRNCAKCHDGADTADGDNWKTELSMQACGSCHDDKDFAIDGSAWGANDPAGHSGGIMTDNVNCINCHIPTIFGSVEQAHTIPGKAEAKNYQLNVIDVTGGDTPSIQFSVTDPNTGIPYDIAAGNAMSNPVFKASDTGLQLQVAWSIFDSGANADFNNVASTPATGSGYTPASAPTPAQPIRLDVIDDGILITCDGVTVVDGDWICSMAANIYTVTKQSALPSGAVGTGRVALEGHLSLPDGSDRMAVRSAVRDFVITGTLTPRRDVVDIDKCNQCHDQLSLHGGNRTDEPRLCVMCHNPSLTDISYNNNFNSGPCAALPYPANRARPKGTDDGLVTGNILYPMASCLDGKTQESADFKRLIHGIHAARRDDPATSGMIEGYGFRKNGIQVRRDDFSLVRFPGILQDCETCHLPGTYVLEDSWEAPTLSGLQSSSVAATPAADATNLDPVVYGDSLNDQADDLRISPTAAACSACHDSAVAQAHMILPGGAVFDKTQGDVTNMVDGNFETCSICHGPGRSFDVEAVHGLD
ncbi:MAG: OmcA/MtrC family decaheme c-type cytochrome [Gammaproteobacteria bacterium]|nr:OmcA/MtrC family decaheme c-type cytochrome [Gammaproteobacteria bacterium]